MVNVVKSRDWSSPFILAFVLLCVVACGSRNTDDQQLVKRAQHYLAQNMINAAAIELRNALQSNPNNAEARYLLGNIVLDFGDFPTAEKEFRRAGDNGWNEQDVLIGLGQAYLGQNRYKMVLKDIQVKDTWPAKVRATILGMYAVAEAGLGNLEPAEAFAAEATKLNADAIQVLKANIQLQILQGRLGVARDTLARALRLYPDDSSLLLMMASIHKHDNNAAAAESIYQRIIDNESPGFMSMHGWRARLELVQMLVLREALVEAEASIKPLYQRNPEDPFTNYLGGVLAFAQQDYDEAEELLLKVLKLAPEHNPTRLLFGTVNYAQGDYEQAAYFLSKYLAVVPENTFARKLLGRSYMLLGQYDTAREILQAALSEKVDDAELLALVGISDLQRGRTYAGIAGLEKAVAAAPGSLALRGELARAYINAGETGLAIKELKEILVEDSGQKQAAVLLVLANLRAGAYEQAINAVLDMLSISPEDPAIIAFAGNVFAASGDRQEARKYFNRALQISPTLQPAAMALARVEELDGNTAEALVLYEGLVATSNEPVVPMLALARLAEQQREYQKMVTWLQQARDAEPREITPRIFLAEYYLRQKQLKDARLLIGEAADISRHATAVLSLQGRLYMAEGHFQKAMTTLSELITAEPGSVASYLLRGECLMRLDRLQEAREDLQFVLDQQAGNITAQALMASIELQAGNPEQALEYSIGIQHVYPELYLGYEIAGDAWSAKQDYEQASSNYAKAWERKQTSELLIKMAMTSVRLVNSEVVIKQMQDWLADHDGDARVRQHLGVIYQKLKQEDKAIAEYEKVLEIEPDNKTALNNLAWLYMIADNPEALSLAERAYKADPENPGVLDTYGWIQVQQGRVEAGLLMLEQAMKELSHIPEVRYHYAAALYKSGDKEYSLEILEELLQGDTPFEGQDEARRILGG